MIGYGNPSKTWMFILGVAILVVSAAGLLINLGYAFAFLTALPANPIIYLAIDAVIGLIMLFIGLKPGL